MTTRVEIYNALRTVGIEEAVADVIAQTIQERGHLLLLVTKADHERAIANLKIELTWRIVGAMAILTAVFSAIVKW